jgi:hypothetical protein
MHTRKCIMCIKVQVCTTPVKAVQVPRVYHQVCNFVKVKRFTTKHIADFEYDCLELVVFLIFSVQH